MLNATITNLSATETIGPDQPTRLPKPFEWVTLPPLASKVVPCAVADVEDRYILTGFSGNDYLQQLVQAGKITVSYEAVPDYTDLNDKAIGALGGGGPPPPEEFAIANFVLAGGTPSQVEIGATVTNPQFTASYTNGPPTSASLDDGTGPVPLTAPFTSFGLGREYTKTAVNAAQTFTLSAAKDAAPVTRTVSIYWRANVFYGVAAVPGAYDAAFVATIAAQATQMAAGRQRSISYNAPAGQKCYYIYPSTFGGTPGNFIDQETGFAAGFSNVATVSVTNGFGVTVGYSVWASDQTGLGAVIINVT